jgi:uncharacterized membrane protein
MNPELTAWVAIVGMGLVTYLTRAAGLFLVARMRVTGRTEAFLSAMPGAILMSIVAPQVAGAGPAELVSALAVLGVAARTRNVLLAIVVGVVLVVALRNLL